MNKSQIFRVDKAALSSEQIKKECIRMMQELIPTSYVDFETSEDVLEGVYYSEHLRILESLINDLEDKEREIMIGRYGLFERKLLTLTELAEKFKTTRENIRQIQARTLRKIKRCFLNMENSDS